LKKYSYLLNNPLVYKELKIHIEKELNPVIRDKIKELIKKI
jgi:hypothetical protein